MFTRGSRAEEGPDTSYWFIHAHLVELSRKERQNSAVSDGRVRPLMKRKRNQARLMTGLVQIEVDSSIALP